MQSWIKFPRDSWENYLNYEQKFSKNYNHIFFHTFCIFCGRFFCFFWKNRTVIKTCFLDAFSNAYKNSCEASQICQSILLQSSFEKNSAKIDECYRFWIFFPCIRTHIFNSGMQFWNRQWEMRMSICVQSSNCKYLSSGYQFRLHCAYL